MKKSLPVIVILVLVAAGLIYYFVAKNDNSNPTSTPNTSQTTNTPSPAKQTANAVTIQNFAFSPANMTVKKGATVTWTNQDTATHTVTETDGQNGPNSGNLSTGKSYSFTFNTVGTFKYKCSIHPNMTGSVTVTE